MEAKKFREECAALEGGMTNVDDIRPIRDGVINIDKYLNARYKILWILKEPYDNIVEGKSGGWSVTDGLNNKKSHKDFKGERATFIPMIYISYGILNGFISMKDIPNIKDEEVFQTLKSIAYINIKKLPGTSTSDSKIIASAYKNNKELLKRQIDTYNPDIIIGGGTLNYFLQDIDLKDEHRLQSAQDKYYVKDGKLYIKNHHPAFRPTKGFSKEDYINQSIKAAKEWSEN
jgi:hypothetical protein